jgi:hypothetical protein
MSGQAEGAAAGEPGSADHPELSGDTGPPEPPAAPSPREVLATSLKTLADELMAAHEELTTWPDDDSKETMAFWREGLDEVRSRIEDSRARLNDCRPFAEAEAIATKPGRGTAKGKLATLLRQFEETIDKTLAAGLAARHALEMADQPFSPGMRSACYMAAAGQLAELAGFCEAISVQVGGPAALIRRERSAAQDGTTQDGAQGT